MGMYGNYVAISNEEFEAIQNESKSLFDVDSDIRLDIDKSWQALYYVLCGDLSDGELPMGYVVPMDDDCELGLEEMEFGSFALSTDKIKEVYDYMLEVDKELLKSMFDIEELVEEEIYPLSEQDLDDGEEIFEYLYQNFEAIKEFYKKALDKNMSVIFYIS